MKDIQKADKKEFKKILNDEKTTLDELFEIRKRAIELNNFEDNIFEIDEKINEKLEDIESLNNLKQIKKIMEKNNMDLWAIDVYINQKIEELENEKKESQENNLTALLFPSLFKSKNNKQKETKEYEDYKNFNYDEEEKEEDDPFYDDLD